MNEMGGGGESNRQSDPLSAFMLSSSARLVWIVDWYGTTPRWLTADEN